MDAQLLASGSFPMLKGDVALGYPEKPGEKGDELGVGPTFHRRRGQTDLEMVPDHVGHGIVARAGLDLNSQYEVRPVPAEPAHR